MDVFEDKLEVQKIAYIGQEFGINLGYPFEWYLRGPYCKAVSKDAHYVIDSKLGKITPGKAGLDERKVKEFAKQFATYLNDPNWLEIAASLIYLRKNNYANLSLEQILGYLIEDLTYGYKNFDEDIVRKVLYDLVKIRLIS